MQTIQVATALEFTTAIASAQEGDRIELAGVDFGDLRIQNADFGAGIVIAAADPDNPPSVNSMSLWNVHGVTIDGLNFDFTPTETTVEWSSALRADMSTDIAVINSSFVGGDSVAGIDAASAAGTQGASGILGWPIGRAITFNDSANITIENNTIEHFQSGIRFGEIDGLTISGNEISDFRQVAVGGGDASNVVIDSNNFHDANPWNFGGAGDHGDYIHIWTTTTQTEPSTNIQISNNFMSQGEGAAILGIYLDDNQNDMGFENVTIDGNVISNNNTQAVRIENVNGLEIVENTILPVSGEDAATPKINLVRATDVTIDQNIYGGISGDALQDLAGNNISIENNLVVQSDFPQAANYIGSLFVNGLTADPSVDDLRILPGSIAEGYGAEMSQVSGASAQSNLIIASDAGEGRDSNIHVFSVSELLATGKASSLEGATVSWTFGDGSTSTGTTVQHSYAVSGLQEVKAVITLASGETIIQEKTIDVQQPIALTADFEDANDTGILAFNGGAALVASDGGTAVALGGDKSYVSFASSSNLLNNEAFSIGFSIQKDSADVGGRVFYYSGTAVIDVGADSISLRGRTDTGDTILLQASGIGVDDTDAHRITYTYDQDSGTAILYVDEQEVVRQEGLTGAQYTTSGHKIYLGNPFGTSFQGLVDDLTFSQYALTADDISHPDAVAESLVEEIALVDTVEPVLVVEAAPTPIASVEVSIAEPGSTVVSFDAVTVAGDFPDGTIYTWDLGDGTSAEGQTVTHTYTQGGSFDATLTVQMPDGTKSSAQATVEVDTPDLIQLGDADSFILSHSGIQVELDTVAQADADGGIQLGGPGVAASVARSHLTPMFNSDDVTISLQLDADAAGTTGEVVRLNGSFLATVTSKGEIAVRATSSNGETVNLTSTGIKVNDGSSHDIDIRLEDGRLSLWVDDTMIRDAAFTGTFADVGSHDLTFGNPWHSSFFNGDVTEFSIAVDDGLTNSDPFSDHALDMTAPLV